MNKTTARLAPFALGLIVLGLWQGGLWITQTPSYIFPSPVDIVKAYIDDYKVLDAGLISTLTVTFTALAAATVIGVALAIAMAASPLLRAAIHPWAVIIQVTPLVSVAPIIYVLINQPFITLVTCATIVAFFTILSNTAAGLAATPPELLDLFRLHGATKWQTLTQLSLPYALPNFLTGLRIAGTLALIGAVVAEFVVGSGGFASGLAWQLIEASYRMIIPRMYAALMLLGISGIIIYAALGLLEKLLLAKRNRA
ncbi:ABC transporter permease [Acidocella sp.]|uniref:ABC transporter permease n=1 Tax=Acidocella sp. TaxID=50710 RepID=UPI00262FECB8|nr:ABC transporter permease [Acidocella sp.]